MYVCARQSSLMASCQKHLLIPHLSTALSETTTSLEQYPLSLMDPQVPQAL